MLFSLQIFQNFLRQKARRISETLALWAIEDLTENQKLDLEFEKFDKFLKSFSEWLKSLARCLYNNTSHSAPISHSKEY